MSFDIPLTRDESFYSTSLSCIVARHPLPLLDLLPQARGLADASRTWQPRVFGPYSTAKAFIGGLRQAFPDAPTVGTAPDIVGRFDLRTEHPGSDNVRLLVGVETKLYMAPTAAELDGQMDQQTPVLQFLQRAIDAQALAHVGLVPQRLVETWLHSPGHVVLTWEAVLDAYERAGDRDPFWLTLREALYLYDDLVSPRQIRRANASGLLPGAEIVAGVRAGTLAVTWMGRQGGLRGRSLQHDLATGRWRVFTYEVCHLPQAPNRNWFSPEDFADLAEGRAA